MALAQPAPHLTEAEYLAIERAAEFKSEFFGGEMFAMAGGTRQHSLIATNLARVVGNALKGKKCVVFNSDLRIKVEATGLFTYPDLSLVCGRAELLSETDDNLINPIVLFEVLSDSTEAYDRGTKFSNYQRIPTLREYLLVSQREARIEQFVRQDNNEWLWRSVDGLDARVVLPSVGVDIPLAEVFANVQFNRNPLRIATPRQGS